MSDVPKNIPVDGATLAQAFGVTYARIQQLATDGTVVKISRGVFDLLQSTKNYCETLRKKKVNGNDGDNSEAGQSYEVHRARKTAAQADIAEMERDLRRGTTHDAAAVAKVWGDMIGNARAKLLSLPTKLAGALDGLTIQEREKMIKDGVNEALAELADYSPQAVTGEWERSYVPNEDEDDAEEIDEDEDEETDAPKK
jgi:phage terminase Nu1 subunit (DNA packaging protein)